MTLLIKKYTNRYCIHYYKNRCGTFVCCTGNPPKQISDVTYIMAKLTFFLEKQSGSSFGFNWCSKKLNVILNELGLIMMRYSNTVTTTHSLYLCCLFISPSHFSFFYICFPNYQTNKLGVLYNLHVVKILSFYIYTITWCIMF